jgi:transcriptional regulator with XRE-family HTH domain
MARPAHARVGAAFRSAYKAAGLRQEDIAAAVGVDQGTISRWASGVQPIPLDYFPKLDDLCSRPHGYLLRLAGYVVDDPGDVLTAIANADDLDETGKRLVSMLYSEVRRPARPTITLQSDPNEDTKSSSSSILP